MAWDKIRSMTVGYTGKDRRNAAEASRLNPSAAPLRGAAMAAGLLESASAPGSGDSLRLEVIRALARDLAEELEALVAIAAGREAAVEGALRVADLANLAASAVPELPEARAKEAVASTHLAAGAARALCVLAGGGLRDGQGEHARNILGDIRGAGWRARLAVRQVDEFFEDEG